ncbi:MAG TPA: 2Fe-2S iron-sulfur cluster binding domain-containing protein [Acidimicrobiia bacterium]|nr:2Fe-2S iron-sulfur cluster binding domain-containing protein [Acidimicrobiia bacterium]
MPTEHDVTTETLVLKLERQTHTLDYQAGDTVLEAARRGGLNPPFSCEQGNCATCMAHLDDGSVRMKANNALTEEDVEEGWILTCQSLPTSKTLTVDYDA